MKALVTTGPNRVDCRDEATLRAAAGILLRPR